MNPCPACGGRDDHHWWPVGDDSYSCSRTVVPAGDERGRLAALLPDWERAWDAHVRASSLPSLITREQHFAEFMRAAGVHLTGDALDVGRLRRAIYTVSQRHDWANTTDTEDRTEEIAAEYGGVHLTGDERLREAARAVVEAWDAPIYVGTTDHFGAVAAVMPALRAALTEPERPERPSTAQLDWRDTRGKP